MSEGFQALAAALILIFCTPLGWVGMGLAGIITIEIIKAKKGK